MRPPGPRPNAATACSRPPSKHCAGSVSAPGASARSPPPPSSCSTVSTTAAHDQQGRKAATGNGSFWGIHLTGAGLVSPSPWPPGGSALKRRRLAACAGWLAWTRGGPGVEHQVAVAHRLVSNGELEDAVEDQAAAA